MKYSAIVYRDGDNIIIASDKYVHKVESIVSAIAKGEEVTIVDGSMKVIKRYIA